jgi:DNA-directed RNA polymerases I, II, and III subunit RPABC2
MHKLELTKYERAKVLGTRALQLSNGAKPYVDITGIVDVIDIAKKELREYKIPIIIRRKMPDGTYIDIKVSEMIID